MAQNALDQAKNEFLNFLSGVGSGVQQGAANLYNVLPYEMQDAGIGNTLKAVSGNNATQQKQAPKNDVTHTQGYKMASGVFGSADMEAPQALENVAGKLMPAIQSKGPNILQKAANKIDSDIGAAKPTDIATNPRAPQQIAPIQESLKRHNVYNASQAGPAMDKIYNEIINPHMNQNSVQVPLDNLVSSIVQEMRKMEPGLDEHAAKNAASKWINNLYDVSRNNTVPSQVVPGAIDSKALLDMKTNLNNTQAVKRFFNTGEIKNEDDLAAIASRNAFSSALEQAHPEIAQYIRDYGNIREAYPSLYDASQKPMPNPFTHPAQVGAQVTKKVVGGTLRTAGNIASTPVGKVAGGVAGIGGAYLAGKMASPQGKSVTNQDNNQTQQPQANTDNGPAQIQPNSSTNESSNQSISTIPQSIEDIKPNPQGKYLVTNPFSLKSTTGSPLVVSDTQYAQQRAAIQNRLNDPNVKFNPIEAQKVESDLANLEAAHASSGDINQAYVAATNLNKQFDNAENILKKTEPNLFTSGSLPIVGKSLAGIRESTDPQYSALVSQLKQLEGNAGLPPGSLYKPGQTKDVLLANLDTERKNMLNNYYSVLKGALGNTQTMGNSGISSINSMPPISSQPTMGTSPTDNLPPINPQFQVK